MTFAAMESQGQTSACFDWLSEFKKIEQMLLTGRNSQVGPYLSKLSRQYGQSRYLRILMGMVLLVMSSPQEAVKSFETATTVESSESLPSLDSPATRVYLEAQMQIPSSERPATQKAKAFFARNIQSLTTVDSDLARELEAAGLGEGLEFIDLWGRIHLFNTQARQVVVISQSFIEQIQPVLHQPIPLALSTVFSGQELPYVLENQTKDFLLGRKRIVYLFESNPVSLAKQLHLFDCSQELEKQELVLFAGEKIENRIETFFGTLRYPPPHVTAGGNEPIQGYVDRINEILDPKDDQTVAEAYYKSAEFAARQCDIAEGKILPRVLVSTCRWTTFLQYCARDFQRAFERLGCRTRYMIEESDVQLLLPRLTWKMLAEFKPDVMFSVSHARPSYNIPKELPFIGYIQDYCGPILTLPDLFSATSRQDLFVANSGVMRRYLVSKNIPEYQVICMGIPADETMFFPLPEDTPEVERFTVDVGYVKHCDAYGEKALDTFLRNQFGTVTEPGVKNTLSTIFTELYKATCCDKDRRVYEDEMLSFVESYLSPSVTDEFRHQVHQLVNRFYISVFGLTWRYQFLEALDDAGIQVGLFGRGWDSHFRLKHFARGSVDREKDLNKVYNFNKINLNIHPICTMHQRVNECALAGGFLLGTNHDLEKDPDHIRKYYEPGREVVLFETTGDLVEKCRYYLEHPKERRVIAANARKRALAERTTVIGAETILEKWREVLQRTLV